jgi:hypothetical protein
MLTLPLCSRRYADGYCNGCGRGPRHLGYPQPWLDATYTNLGYDKDDR